MHEVYGACTDTDSWVGLYKNIVWAVWFRTESADDHDGRCSLKNYIVYDTIMITAISSFSLAMLITSTPSLQC